jgi:hypothetical protein
MPFKIVEETIEYITRSPHQLDFLMQICHHETEPESSRLWLSGVTVGGGYFCGGITSLLPYFWSRNVFEGLVTSICIMSVALLLFGYSKTCLISGWSGRQNIRLGVRGWLCCWRSIWVGSDCQQVRGSGLTNVKLWGWWRLIQYSVGHRYNGALGVWRSRLHRNSCGV